MDVLPCKFWLPINAGKKSSALFVYQISKKFKEVFSSSTVNFRAGCSKLSFLESGHNPAQNQRWEHYC